MAGDHEEEVKQMPRRERKETVASKQIEIVEVHKKIECRRYDSFQPLNRCLSRMR
jgi:hypothetical protein